MTIKRKSCLVGAFEHPRRKAEDKSVAQLHAEVAKGALEDAGLTLQDVDRYFCAGAAAGAFSGGLIPEGKNGAATGLTSRTACARVAGVSVRRSEAIRVDSRVEASSRAGNLRQTAHD